LKHLKEQSELLFTERVGNNLKKSLGQRQHTGNSLAVRSANMRALRTGFERHGDVLKFCVEKTATIVKPAKIGGDWRLRDGQFESCKYRLQIINKNMATL